MTRHLRTIATAVAMTAFLTAGGGAAAAMAEEPAPLDSGSAIAPTDSSITLDERAPRTGVAPLTVVNIGGGTWNYGSAIGIWPPKTCWSNYIHNSKYHSSTAIIANSNVKVYANAGSWSNASTWAGAAYTCYAYWATY